MTNQNPDFLIIGGGVIGLSLALEVKRRHPDAGLCLIEKEPACGLHAGGRNEVGPSGSVGAAARGSAA